MNAVEFAKGHIFREIDNDVLNFAFRSKITNFAIGIPSVIEHIIIRNMVILELNLLEGEEKKIPISSCVLKFNNNGIMALEIPKQVLNFRPLLSADYIISAPYNFVGANVSAGLNGALKKMVNSVSTVPVTSNARIEILNENTIKIEGTDYLDPYSTLSVRVQNNPNMSNIPLTSHIKFGELCEFATQKWIYTHKRKEIENNIITGGSELIGIKAIVDEWSDSKDKYQEARKKFVAILNMADSRFSEQQTKSRMGNLNY